MCSTKIFLAIIFNEIECHVNTFLGLVGGKLPYSPYVHAWFLACLFSLTRPGSDPGGGRLELSSPPETCESNLFHHDFLQFGKTPDCLLRLHCQIFLKSPPLNLRTGSAPGQNTTVFAFTGWIHCIKKLFTFPWKTEFSVKFFTVLNIYFTNQDFWATLRLPWKTELPWKFSLCWNIFYHSGFLSNLRLPWKQSLPWKFSRQGGGHPPNPPPRTPMVTIIW